MSGTKHRTVGDAPPPEPLVPEVPRGLEGVVVSETTVGDVRGTEGFYHYRQYNAVELAETRTLEDVWYLLFEGELPTLAQRDAFIADTRPLREIPAEVLDALPAIATAAPKAPPLDQLRTMVSLFGATLGFRPSLDLEADELRAQAWRVCAVVPTLLCALYCVNNGRPILAPHPELPYAANYLYMMKGEVPTPEHARAVEQYLISTIDHGFNASTFAARVITSTGADLAAAVVGGIGALSGPLHGGAPSRALDMLEEIGTIDKAEPWIRNAIERGDKLMGFGHRAYKTIDPRSVLLRQVAERLGGPNVEFAEEFEQKAVDLLAELKPGRKLYANVEFYAGIVMDACGGAARDVHADVRVEPSDRLDHAHPRAGRRQPAHPPECELRRTATTATGTCRRMNVRRGLAVALLSTSLALGATACSSSDGPDGGATTDLSEVGPDIARLQAQIDALNQEVRSLRRQLAALDPSSVTTTTTSPLR